MKSRLIIILFFLIPFFGCNVEKDKNEIDRKNERSQEVKPLEFKNENRDIIPSTLYNIISTYLKSQCVDRFSDENSSVEHVRISKSYTSPDSSKFLVLVSYQKPVNENRTNPKYDFEINGYAFIGYYLNDSTPVLYRYDWYTPVGWLSYKVVDDMMIDYFESDGFRSNVFVYKSDDKEGEISICPNEKDFWKSSLWKKNLEIPNKYPFEIKRSAGRKTKVMKSVIEELIECSEYPLSSLPKDNEKD